MKKLVLIDSNALVHRAFHALPPLSSPTGAPTNAVYGFLSVLLKMIVDLKPDYIAATFDLAGPTFRHKEYEEYKAHRTKAPDELYAQIPVVKEMLSTFGIPIYEQAGFEADDVIGSVAEQTKHIPDLQTIIVTGDLDTLQLVHGTSVVVFTLRKGMTDTIIYDEKAVRERFNLEPSQVVDFKGLKGDPSDNIPGVPGIGEKTASTLIQHFGSIEKLYSAIESGNTQKPLTEKLIANLIEHKDMALFSKKLATIILTVDVQFELNRTDWKMHLNTATIEAKCQELGFYSLVKRIHTTLNTVAKETATQSFDLRSSDDDTPSASTAIEGAGDLPKGNVVAMHGEFDGAIVTKLHLTTDGTTPYTLIAPTPDILATVIERYPKIIGHGLKPIFKALPNLNILEGKKFIDTQIGAWLCSPDQRDHSLEHIYYSIAAQTLPTDQSQWPLAIWQLEPLIWDKLKAVDELNVFTEMEMPLIPILAGMERRGILVDTAKISTLLTTSTAQVHTLEQEIYKLAGTQFNINSPSQLSNILFNTLAIHGKVRRTGGGAPSTAASELEKLRQEHPVVDLVLEYRELNKLKTTYIEPFPALVASDGRIHTTYNQAGAATGRMSSSDPNLQNIPARTELGQQFRAAFIADKNTKLVSLDYSQLELRIAAHIAQDETMIEAFRNGEDIHTRTASEIFGIAPEQVTKEMRNQAKVLNFGIMYGMGTLGFARAAGVSRDTAKKFIEEYFARFKGIANYMEQTKNEAFEKGYVSTLFGRRRMTPDIKSHMPQLAAQAERMAINHPIQGTEADLVKFAMISLDNYIEKHRLGNIARPLLQVHDELVLEVAADQAESIGRQVKTVMEQVHTLDVPLVVDIKIGDNWSEMTQF